MRSLGTVALTAALAGGSIAAVAFLDVPPATSSDARLLKGKPLEPLMPFIGAWEIEARWSFGQDLWSRNEYRVLMNGSFVEAITWAKDGEGTPYARYLTVYAWDPEQNAIVGHGFTNDGSASALAMRPIREDDRLIALGAEWPTSDAEDASVIRQQVSIPDGDDYRWQVWMIQPDGTTTQMMDGVWKRVR